MIFIIIIDPGHGGIDFGKASNIYFNEKDKNLQISHYLYDRMLSLGIKAYLTRTTDELLLPDKRIQIINSFKDCNILISTHLGYFTSPTLLYSKRCDIKLINSLEKELNFKNNQIKLNSYNDDFYYILREANLKNSLIIFYGNTSAINDLNNLLEDWINLSERIIKGLCNYLSISYQEPKEKLYIIKRKDTLESISKDFNISVNEIMKINNLNSKDIFPYGILKLHD